MYDPLDEFVRAIAEHVERACSEILERFDERYYGMVVRIEKIEKRIEDKRRDEKRRKYGMVRTAWALADSGRQDAADEVKRRIIGSK